MSFDIALGRWLALCAHPKAAWRVLPASGRWLMAASYAAVGYGAVLTCLLLL